ncbi:MAG: hypothetical protein K2N85_05525, partial [Lachnospiraceae bacterium]|nr:hypothetical protein [Lachnospiraceae bacterium]
MESMGKNVSKTPEKRQPEAFKASSESALFSLRNKIYICFLIPIVFMIAVGLISYRSAQEGLSEKFKESSIQTSNMAIQYLDTSCTYIQSEGMRYAFDNGIDNYTLGMPGKSLVEKTTYFSDTKLLLLASQTANPFVSNIHIIPKAGNWIISSATAEYFDGIYDDYYSEMLSLSSDGRNIPRWVDSHPFLSEHMGISEDDYFIAYQIQTNKKFGYVVVDVETDALVDILENMDFGKGSIVGFVTDSGKEVIVEGSSDEQASLRTNGEGIFSQQDFYAQSIASEEMSGVMDVKYQGKSYLYVYTKSDVCNVTLCSL